MNIEATLQYWKALLGELPGQVRKMEDKRGIELQWAQNCDSKMADALIAKEFYKRAVDVVYQASVGELEKVVNLALEFIFSDTRLQAEFKTSEARGVKTMTIILEDLSYDPPLEIDIKDGIGAGVRTVVSLVLHVFYLINKKAFPVLFVDEGYSNLSEEYVEKFFTFIKGLCEKKNFHIILISHDPRFMEYADKKYMVNDGVVKEMLASGQVVVPS